MVGFPGETDEEFQDLKSLVEELKFEHLGCFTYSQEEGTVAGRMSDQVDDETKQKRQDIIMSLQKAISREKLRRFVGQRIPVLVAGPSEESDLLWQGRMSVQAPEVDGVVYLNDGPVKAGNIQYVEITDSYEYDLVGRVIQ
jgi:ribosomal protein S12 methylthiotransferase